MRFKLLFRLFKYRILLLTKYYITTGSLISAEGCGSTFIPTIQY